MFGGKIELLADVENVLNLLDKDWGTIRQVGFPYTSALVNVACNTGCTQYTYSSFRAPIEATQINGSLWGVRFGVRVAF